MNDNTRDEGLQLVQQRQDMAEDDDVELVNFPSCQGWVECENLQGVACIFVPGKEDEEGDPKPLYEEDKVYERLGPGVWVSKVLKCSFAEAIDNIVISRSNSYDEADKVLATQ